jgi:FtsP/CotA-like multicopper oxidase with cupredoxin domain
LAYSRTLPSRRQVVAGGLAAVLPAPARGQPAVRVLRAQPGDPGWSYDGSVPGPLLRVKRGEEVAVRLVNELTEPTTIHWHGVRLPNAMDGVPGLTQEAVAPGASFDYRFTPPDAGTFWYRPHSRAQQRRGLAGVLIVDEAPLGVDRDVALVLGPGADGDTPQVNGLASLDIPVRTNERLRLRLINAAERIVALRVERHAATVMAIDGQPAEPFLARESRVALGPGNRIDLFVDARLSPGSMAAILAEVPGGETALARLVYGAGMARAEPPAETKPLPPNPLPARIEFRGAFRGELLLESGLMKPAQAFGPPLFSVRRGRTVMLALPNRSHPCAVHVHGHHLRLLDNLDDGWKPFWLDTVLVGPGETARVAFLADNPGKWLIEGHVPGRPEAVFAWFEVA